MGQETWVKHWRRINEGAAMIRCKGEAGTGDVSSAVDHIRTIKKDIEEASKLKTETEIVELARELRVPTELLIQVIEKKLPVVLFCAGGVSTPADAALLMQLGCDGVLLDLVFSNQRTRKIG